MYPALVLEPGPIPGWQQEMAEDWATAFDPLDFDAGHRAKAWLETNLSTGVVPLLTYLVYSEDDSESYGLFALDQVEIDVAPFDRPILKARHAIEDVNVGRHPATKLVWVARAGCSPSGFGAEMFEHAMLKAAERGSCALLVDAADQETAERLWMKHYDMRQPRDGAAQWTSLWHPLGEANEDFN
jgi:hypothetical protein